MFISVQAYLKTYVMTFEKKTPLIHKLHEHQLQLFKNFHANFVRPESIVSKTAKTLSDPTSFPIGSNTKKSKYIFIGQAPHLNKHLSQKITEDIPHANEVPDVSKR